LADPAVHEPVQDCVEFGTSGNQVILVTIERTQRGYVWVSKRDGFTPK